MLAQRLAQFARGHGGGVAAGRVGDVVVPQGPGDGQHAAHAQHAQGLVDERGGLLRLDVEDHHVVGARRHAGQDVGGPAPDNAGA